MRRRRWTSLLALAVLLLAACRLASAQSVPAVSKAVNADASAVFGDLISRFYKACGIKDLAAVEAAWHPNGPIRSTRNLLEVDFETRTLTLVAVTVTRASIDAGGGRARALVDLDVTQARTGRTRRERWVRELTFLEDAGGWKIWNDSSTALAGQLAERLESASPAEREALIASDAEIRSEDTLAGLSRVVNRRRSQGALGEVLDVIGLRTTLARALGNESALAASLLDAGLVLQVIGRQAEAGQAFAETRDLFVRTGTRSEVALVDGNLASVEYVLGHYEAAAGRYRQALEAFDAEKDEAHAASMLHGLGNALYMLGDFEPAMASYQRCLRIHEAAKNQYAASSVLQAMALVHKETGSYAASADTYARSVSASLAVDDPLGAARGQHGIGEISRLLGDYARALQHLAASLALWQKTRDPIGRAGTLYTIGQVYAARRDFPKSVEAYQQALDTDQKAGDQAAVARDLGGLAGAHFGQGQLATALDEYRRSLAIREQLHDGPGVTWTTVHLGVLQTAMGNHLEALESYQRALSLAEPAGDPGAVCTILALRAASELAREDADTALSTAGKAAEIAERLQLFDVLAQARLVAGKAHRNAGRPAEAVSLLQSAVTATEQVPVGPGVETFFDDRRAPYTALVNLLASENRPADAFRWLERARTRSLASLLGGDGAAVTTDMTDAERDEERRLAREARVLAVRLKRERGRNQPDAARIGVLQQEYERAVEARTAYRRRLFDAHPRLASLRSQQAPAEVDRAADVLAPSEALVSFSVSDAGLTALVVSRAAAGGVVVNAAAIDVKPAVLSARVTAMREAVEGREARAETIARELHDLLIAPIRDWLGDARALVVVPDASLWALPFEALRSESGRFLVQDLAVSYAPSLTGLVAMRSASAQRRPRPSLVATADPALSPAAHERLELMGVTEPDAAAAAREARRAVLLFGPAASRLLLKSDARLDRVLSAEIASKVVHLAVPGCLDEASPLYSVLALASAGRGDADAGLVEAGDLLGTALPAGLAVLPLVRQGRAASGDATVVFAWSLFVAGTPAVLVSRWIPGTGSRAGLVTAFYESWLRKDGPKAERRSASAALQRAMRAIAARPGTAIADWAGMMAFE